MIKNQEKIPTFILHELAQQLRYNTRHNSAI